MGIHRRDGARWDGGDGSLLDEEGMVGGRFGGCHKEGVARGREREVRQGGCESHNMRRPGGCCSEVRFGTVAVLKNGPRFYGPRDDGRPAPSPRENTAGGQQTVSHM